MPRLGRMSRLGGGGGSPTLQLMAGNSFLLDHKMVDVDEPDYSFDVWASIVANTGVGCPFLFLFFFS